MTTRPRRVPFLLTIGVTLIMVLIGLWQMRVADISCQFGGQVCPAEVTAGLVSLRGKSLLFTDVLAASRKALQAHTAYRVISISKRYPDKLSVVLEPQSLDYQLKLVQQDQYASVTDLAQVLPVSAGSDAPVIVVEEPVWTAWTSTGQISPQTHSQLAELPLLLGEAMLTPQGLVLMDEQTLVVYLANQQTAVMDIADLQTDFSRLVSIIRGIQDQELPQPVEEIDLRFKLPVLRFSRTIPRHESL